MSIPERIPTERPETAPDDFSRFFPDGQLMTIERSAIPARVKQKFEGKSRLFIPDSEYRPENFEKYMAIHHRNGDITYVAQQTKTDSNDESTEQLTYFIETRNGEIIGHAEIRNHTSDPQPYFKDKPFVGYTYTEEPFRTQGLGTRRLLQMNAFTQAEYHLPLYSSTLNSEENLWDHLVVKGLARAFREGKHRRYVFASPPAPPA